MITSVGCELNLGMDINGQIRRSRLINWLAAAIVAILASYVPYDHALEGLAVPPLLISLTLAVVLLELIRRGGLRARLTWNSHGVDLVYAFRNRHINWHDINDIQVASSRINLITSAETVSWEFDQPWLLSKLSPRYARRADHHQQVLQEAMAAAHTVDLPTQAPMEVPADRSFWVYTLLILVVGLTPWFGSIIP
ncbi:hypothetical protein [Amycolatopsis azurea]|nr:hypothetical protein [Amycolatopsis azurea]